MVLAVEGINLNLAISEDALVHSYPYTEPMFDAERVDDIIIGRVLPLVTNIPGETVDLTYQSDNKPTIYTEMEVLPELPSKESVTEPNI